MLAMAYSAPRNLELRMTQRLFIHANNIHQGGGYSLLLALLKTVSSRIEWFANLDRRVKLFNELLIDDRINWISPSSMGRLISEWQITKRVLSGDVLLCFGNLPPLFPSHGYVVVFVQNRYLLDRLSLQGFPLSVRLRIRVERWWLRNRARNVDLFVVQTPTMKALLQSRVASNAIILPFAEKARGYSRREHLVGEQSSWKYNFLYVASGEPHKNHRNLIEAWCLLAADGLFPSLCLTLDETKAADLCLWVESKRRQSALKVENLGTIAHAQVLALYSQVQALIFPSMFESFGLPLIEARQAGLPILAPELDYVRDVLDPEEVFDPASPVSIARAVKRFMGVDENPLPLLDAQGFVKAILSNSGLPAAFRAPPPDIDLDTTSCEY